MRGNVPASVIQIVKTVAALSIRGAVFSIITLPVKVWKIPSARPQVISIDMILPNTEKTLIVALGNFKRPIIIITEITIAGKRFISTLSGEMLITIPEIKQPTGIVLIPQRRPKRTSS